MEVAIEGPYIPTEDYKISVDLISLDFWEHSHIFLMAGNSFYTAMIDGEIHMVGCNGIKEFVDVLELSEWLNENKCFYLGTANPTEVIDRILEAL
tara:strand:- start:70 stop:354 length:285 start_codon:yes stop_codon:yes gene_type:complete